MTVTVRVKDIGDRVLPETREHNAHRTATNPLTRINPTSAPTLWANVVGHEANTARAVPCRVRIREGPEQARSCARRRKSTWPQERTSFSAASDCFVTGAGRDGLRRIWNQLQGVEASTGARSTTPTPAAERLSACTKTGQAPSMNERSSRSGGGRHQRLSRRTSILVALAALTVCGASGQLSAQTDAGADARPNILVFLSDDMGWRQPGFNGGTDVATPSMDRIAHEGVKLTQFYVQPACSPTRASLLTGRYPWKNGMEVRPDNRASQGMLTDERTIAEALRDAGYATWIVGKWHLGQWQQDHLPLQRGFDHHYGLYSALIDSFTHQRGGILDWHRNGRPVVESGYSTFLLAEEAIQLIERHDGASPFFLYLPFNAVHNPFAAPRELIDLFPHIKQASRRKQRAMLKGMDIAIGRVLDALERKDVLDDTLVIFLNDNGGSVRVSTQGLNSPYRGRKTNFFEGGIRVPAVMRWPGEIPAGSESDALLHVVDLFPTFAGLAGADPHAGLPLDGLDAWDAITGSGESPRTEVVHSLGVIRAGDWKLIEQDERRIDDKPKPRELFNIAEDPYETTNLAAIETSKVEELQARLAYHAQFARVGETPAEIPNFPPDVHGAAENAAYGREVRRAIQQRENGNLGPTLLRLEVDEDEARLVYDETLSADSVPPADAFKVVLVPGYTALEVTDVQVSGREVLLTLAQTAGTGETVGLTYEVPDSGAVRDEDRLAAVGVTWVTAEPEGSLVQAPLTASFEAGPSSHDGSSPFKLRLRFSEAVATSDVALRTAAIGLTGGQITHAQRVAGLGWLWELTVVPSGAAPVVLTLPATASCSAIGAVCTAGGKPLSNSLALTIPGKLPVVSISGPPSPVTEGAEVAFEVSLDREAVDALTVPVRVSETGSVLAGTPAASVTIPRGGVGATLSVPTEGDTVIEADSTVTASLSEGTVYVLGAVSSASVTVEDDDEAAFAVSAAPEAIAEGESATLTVAISNSVTFAGDQAIELTVSGTASAADYSLTPTALTLAAGASSAAAALGALPDQEEEADETVTVTASHRGIALGSATVAIASVSHDATLSALGLSGIDIGTFASGTAAYTASVPHATSSTAVTATASHPEAEVSIAPGLQVSLAEGANQITVTVTAEDGTTTRTYTVTVTRAAATEATITALASAVTEGAAAEFEVRLGQAAAEALTVAVSVTETGSMLSGASPASVAFSAGDTRATLSVATAGDSVVEADSAVTASVAAGPGYTVGTASSATVTVEDDDIAAFVVSVAPAAIDEGESATLTVGISNGVTFAGDQTLALALSGTASASDYALSPAALTLAAGSSSVTAAVTAARDAEEEADETLTVTASHGGVSLGSATVTIASVSQDATLKALGLSGIDIGTFASATTAYEASVPHARSSTTVTATASHGGATVSIAPGSEVSLAEGANQITVTVTAEDGTTTRSYTVTVTRASLPVVSIVAVAQTVSEEEPAVFRVSRTGPTTELLAVQVGSTTSRRSGGSPRSVRLLRGQRSRETRTQLPDDTVVREDVTVTKTLEPGEGYTIAPDAASATVVVEENDVAEFALSVEPDAIDEGESATLTVGISNGVTFEEDQTLALAASGTASASDYALSPAALTLVAGASSGTVGLAATEDREEEADETVTLTASHGGVEVGSATLTIVSVSKDATLSSLSLSGVDIGTFSAATTAYAASAPASLETTTVTATASRSEASVAIAPGPEVSLAEGGNTVTVTVTAEDGQTTRTYTVTVTRARPPAVSIVAVAGRVSEGEPAVFRVSLTEPATERLRVGMRWSRSDQSQSLTQYTQFHVGMSSKLPSFSKSDDKVVREDLTVSITLEDGAGYRVSEDARSAQVLVEENDAAEFALSVSPASVAEGGTASVRVRTTNGVTFAEAQTIALGFAGSTATKGADYSVSAESLRLRAGRRRVTASLTAIADSDQEGDETVRVEAVHGGAVIGTATLTITGSEPEAEAAGEGFSLAPENSSPSGIWSDGQTAWVADLADARLYAYRREDGERQPDKDMATEPSPMGLWSDGQTLWVAQQGGGLKAHRLADGARLAGRDLALEADAAPAGVWSDGQTAWVSNWLGDTVHAYSLEDGRRAAGRDIQLAGGNLMPAGLWSDGQTLWVADWRERLYAYRLSDGGREPGRDLVTGTGDTDPTGLWSGGGTLLATSWESGEVRARRLPALPVQAGRPGKGQGAFLAARAASMPAVPDPALQAAIGAALGKAPGEAVSADELAGLEALAARNRGIRDLSGLERATGLVELDLGFNPLDDLRALVLLPALESLNLDGAAPEPHLLASLQGLRRLSLRNNGIDDLGALAALAGLTELDVGDNLVQDLSPLLALTALKSCGRTGTVSATCGRWRRWPGWRRWTWGRTGCATCGRWRG